MLIVIDNHDIRPSSVFYTAYPELYLESVLLLPSFKHDCNSAMVFTPYLAQES